MGQTAHIRGEKTWLTQVRWPFYSMLDYHCTLGRRGFAVVQSSADRPESGARTRTFHVGTSYFGGSL